MWRSFDNLSASASVLASCGRLPAASSAQQMMEAKCGGETSSIIILVCLVDISAGWTVGKSAVLASVVVWRSKQTAERMEYDFSNDFLVRFVKLPSHIEDCGSRHLRTKASAPTRTHHCVSAVSVVKNAFIYFDQSCSVLGGAFVCATAQVRQHMAPLRLSATTTSGQADMARLTTHTHLRSIITSGRCGGA